MRKQHPEFKKLGFHHLWKTAGNEIRRIADGETMGVFLRHGKPVKTDVLAGTYSNPVYERVFAAQDKLWEEWKDIFPPLGEVELPRKLSPDKIRQIRRLKTQGVPTKELAERYGVCADTIRVYCRKKKPAASAKKLGTRPTQPPDARTAGDAEVSTAPCAGGPPDE